MKLFTRHIILIWTVLEAALPPTALAQFTPGHVFLSQPSFEMCGHGIPDSIWEIDPETGEVTLFAELTGADCGVISGLVVTPDGCGLRVSAARNNRILEFDAEGNWTVALDATDSISYPWGSNNLAYDRNGNFYVVNGGSRTILRFPADGGPGTVFADAADGVQGGGPIAIASDGDLYYANRYVLRILPNGEASLFDDYGNRDSPLNLSADSDGHLYVSLGGGDVLKYVAGDAGSEMLLFSATDDLFLGVLAPVQGEKSLFAVGKIPPALFRIDTDGGEVTLVAPFPSGVGGLYGIAVVPTGLGDVNRDGRVGLDDVGSLTTCLAFPAAQPVTPICSRSDLNFDGSVSLRDFSILQNVFGRVFPNCP